MCALQSKRLVMPTNRCGSAEISGKVIFLRVGADFKTQNFGLNVFVVSSKICIIDLRLFFCKM